MNAFTHARDGQRPSAGEDFVSHVSFLLVVMVLCVVCAQVLFQLPCTVGSVLVSSGLSPGAAVSCGDAPVDVFH